ncbi:lectin BRA-3-like [Dreissena polymorpha]|uniref:lectin BRA-3-like n=1 Tax=Dreissena polymorpha TaxID=45954 RepID=UPI002264A383|nr:lectin BRA-3-like [Dreissena polymorpha]
MSIHSTYISNNGNVCDRRPSATFTNLERMILFNFFTRRPRYDNELEGGQICYYGHSTEDCVVLTDQSHNWTWDDRPCNEYHGFVCEYSSNTITYACSHPANIPGNYEPGSLFTVDNRCYELVRTSHAWRVAENNCINKGGHLASIDNIRQQSGVFQVVRGSGLQNVWIGLHDHDIEEHYSRTSGSVAGFTNFITSHTNLHNSQDCVSLEAQTGLWHDELFTEANPYLCEIGTLAAGHMPNPIG